MSQKLLISLLLVNSFTISVAESRGALKFFLTSLNNMKTVGSLFPISKEGVKVLTKDLDTRSSDKPLHILEVGAGVGNITEILLEKMGPDDTLEVIEILPENCAILVEKFKDKRITIHQADFLQWESIDQQKYDLVISTVPHISLGYEFTKQAFEKYHALTAGTLVFVQLSGIHYLKMHSHDYHKVQEILETNNDESTLVWWNLPVPVRVYRKKMR